MKLASHYIRLSNHYSQQENNQEIAVTLDELAHILNCTHRNVVLLLKRMKEHGWIHWSPKRSRGNRSKLAFLIRSEELIFQIAKDLVEKKDLRSALEQMNVSAIPSSVKDHFHDWLYSYFGYITELKNNRKVDILRFPLNQPIHTLDPLRINFAGESHLVSQIFDSLVRYNRLTQTVEPHLAHAWETDAARTSWTFYLRKGVQFHHGREMSAQDVKYSLDRLIHSQVKSLYRWMHAQITEINVIDPATLQVKLLHPNELFMQFLSTTRASILPKDVSTQSEDRFGKSPVGTGPFKLAVNDHSMCVLEAFPYYFQGRAHLDRVEIWNITELYTQDGQKGLKTFPIIHNYRLPEGMSNETNQVLQLGTICKFLTLNVLKEGPLKTRAVREAFCRLIQPKLFIEKLIGPGDALFPSDGFLTGSEQDEGDDGNVEDADQKSAGEEANTPGPSEALRRAGYGGKPLELCTIPHYEGDAASFQSICKEAGIEVKVTLLPPEEFKSEHRLKADFILFAVILDNDVELRLIDLYKSMQHHLEPRINKAIEDSIANILSEPIGPKRTLLFESLEHFLIDESCIRFLYHKHVKTVYHRSVKGISIESIGWMQFKNIWFKPELTSLH